ncbi:MAG: Uma2 family endonuclease [candidate division NC10 bacterium]|nr:Uma2 family endonuclease [candidate division NC10 bacterium]
MTSGIVTTSPLVRQYTLREFWDLPAPPQGGHHELIAGVLYMVPPPSELHNLVVARLNRRIAGFLDRHPGLGELYVPRAAIWTPENTYLAPDLMFVSRERLPSVTGLGELRCADLVVEAFSQRTELYDRQTKADTYAALKVPELWLVNLTRHEFEQRLLEAGAWRTHAIAKPGDILRSHVVPGLTVTVAEIFEGLPRE